MSDLVIGINRTLQIISARLTPGAVARSRGCAVSGLPSGFPTPETPQPRDCATAMVAPGRLERPTNGLGNRCSIHLSYGGKDHDPDRRRSQRGRRFHGVNLHVAAGF